MKMVLGIIGVLFFSASYSVAQVSKSGPVASDSILPLVGDEMAEFPGGQQALYKFIKEHICYPDSAKKMGIQGKVYVAFIIDSTGKVSDPVIKRGLGSEFDTLVLQMMSVMPNWIPSRFNGKAISQRYTLPISFKLDNSTSGSGGNFISAVSCKEFMAKRRRKKE